MKFWPVVYLLVLVSAMASGVYLTNLGTSVDESKPSKLGVLHAIKDIPYGYAELSHDLQVLEQHYSTWLTIDVLAKSVRNRNVYLARLGHGPPTMIVVGSHHGREWMTSKVLVKLLLDYVDRASLNQKAATYDIAALLDQIGILFIPMLNPDGVEISLRGLAAGGDPEFLLAANDGQQDFSRWKGNANGVNLNIQYNGNWDQAASEPLPHYEKYKGTHPESEPESQALANLIRERRPRLVLSYHSSGQVIYWQYGQPAPFLERDREIAHKLSELTGYQLAKEPDLHSHGGLKDWFVQTFEHPAFTIEIGLDAGDGPVPLNQFEQIVRENYEALLYAASKSKQLAQ